MRKIPIHQTVVLTEGSIARPVEQQITVPDIVATLRNTLGDSIKSANQVEGAVEMLDALDELILKLGE